MLPLPSLKDLTSEPLENAKLPGIVYLLVDKNIELETKYLKDFIYLTKGTDKIRNEKFGDAMPEFNQILLENGIDI